MADADALFDRTVARLIEQDIAAARDLFRQAGEAGRHDAAVIHCNLVAQGENWGQDLALLRQLAQSDRRCRTELSVVRSMKLTALGDPLTMPPRDVIGESPHLTVFPQLFSRDECQYPIRAAQPMLEPSAVLDNGPGNTSRPSAHVGQCRLNPTGGEPIGPRAQPPRRRRRRHDRRAGRAPPGPALPAGQEYKPHFDATSPASQISASSPCWSGSTTIMPAARPCSSKQGGSSRDERATANGTRRARMPAFR